MVQPAVSATISELEKYYGAALFDRINQRLVLTELGSELLVRAKSILLEFEEFEETALLGGKNPKIRIGSSLTLGRTLAPRYFKALSLAMPSLSPSFIIDKSSVIEDRLERGELDVGIIEGEPLSKQLRKIEIGEDQLVAACSPSFDAPSEIELSSLALFPLLLRERGSASRELFERELLKKSLKVKPFVESRSNEALISFAKAGAGIALLPEGIVGGAIKQGELLRIEITDAELSRRHYLLLRQKKSVDGAFESAIELLFACAKEEKF